MRSRTKQLVGLSLALLSGITAGCASTSDQTTAASATVVEPALKLPTLPSLGDVTALAPAPAKSVGSATELYSRIARGANTCWFGGSGPLKKAFIYHAEADAPSRGGKAEITIHERDLSQPNPRGAKAFKINIDPKGEDAEVKTENLKMAENVSAAMTSDVDRWSKGDQGCASISTATAAGWMPAAPTHAAPVKPAKAIKKPSQKAKTVATSTKPKVGIAPVPTMATKPALQQ